MAVSMLNTMTVAKHKHKDSDSKPGKDKATWKRELTAEILKSVKK